MNRKALGVVGIALLVSLMALLLVGDSGLPSGVVRTAETSLAAAERARDALSGRAVAFGRLEEREPALLASAGLPERFEGARADAAAKLMAAEATADELRALLEADERGSAAEAVRLSGELEAAASAALASASAVIAEAEGLIAFKAELPARLERFEADHGRAVSAPLAEADRVVRAAQADWPEKSSDLERRLSALAAAAAAARSLWDETAGLRAKPRESLTADEMRRLADAAEAMAGYARDLEGAPARLDALTDQLYWSWEKVLADLEIEEGLDVRFFATYRTIRTRAVATEGVAVGGDGAGVGAGAGPGRGASGLGVYGVLAAAAIGVQDGGAAGEAAHEVSESRVALSRAEYEANKRHLGMTVERKAAGRYDHEAEDVVQPGGMAYIAEPGSRNRYGFWNNGIWVWYGQYAFMRDLFWGPRWSVGADDWRGYDRARRGGRTYFGDGAGRSPRYGSEGALTASSTRYSGSRFVRTGGFRSSRYVQSGGSYRGSRFAGGGSSQGSGGSRSFRSGGWGSSGSRSGGFGGK